MNHEQMLFLVSGLGIAYLFLGTKTWRGLLTFLICSGAGAACAWCVQGYCVH